MTHCPFSKNAFRKICTTCVTCFIERLEIEGAEEREWIMMAIINICAVLEYGRASSLLRRVGCFGSKEGPQAAAAMRVMAKKAAAGIRGMQSHHEADKDVDNERDRDVAMKSLALRSADAMELLISLKSALQLTFNMLVHVLKNPLRKVSPSRARQ